jgi:hypothetical protein
MSGPLPLITLPDFETLVVERLYLCCQEISGLTVFKLAPVNSLPPETFPICYPWVAPMTESIPIETNGAGSITVKRDYVVRIQGDPVPSTQDNSTRGGAQGLVNLLPYFNLVRQYFIGHPKLETTTLGSLQYMSGQLTLYDGGFAEQPGPGGGTDHFTINIPLSITMKCQVATLA